MNDTGFGLFNRELIAAILMKWQEGNDIGVLFIRLRPAAAPANVHRITELRSALMQRARGFWSSSLDGDYYWLVECRGGHGNAVHHMNRLTGQLLNWLAEKAERYEALQPIAGYSLLQRPDRLEDAETELYKAIRAAAGQAIELHYETAAASEAPTLHRSVYEEQYGIERLVMPIPVFRAEQKVSELNHYFTRHQQAQGVVVVRGLKPVGLIMKDRLHQLLSGPYGLALYSAREVARIMDASPLIIEEGMPVEQAAQQAMERETAKMYDVVIVTDKAGKLLGAVSIRSLLECITALRTEAARTASPLTGLPGNERIQAKLEGRLLKREPVSIIYADIDYFKWYNDCFGFAQGDKMIRYLADTLVSQCMALGSPGDFVGHVGGDDFIVVSSAFDPERLCGAIIEAFDKGIVSFYDDTEITEVQDRQGRTVERSGVSLSLALLCSDGSRIYTSEQISRLAAGVKKRAKSVKGSSYVKENLHQSER